MAHIDDDADEASLPSLSDCSDADDDDDDDVDANSDADAALDRSWALLDASISSVVDAAPLATTRSSPTLSPPAGAVFGLFSYKRLSRFVCILGWLDRRI